MKDYIFELGERYKDMIGPHSFMHSLTKFRLKWNLNDVFKPELFSGF